MFRRPTNVTVTVTVTVTRSAMCQVMFDLEKEDSDKLKRGLDEIKELGETAADDALDPYERLS
jgi:hypothetical protein